MGREHTGDIRGRNGEMEDGYNQDALYICVKVSKNKRYSEKKMTSFQRTPKTRLDGEEGVFTAYWNCHRDSHMNFKFFFKFL